MFSLFTRKNDIEYRRRLLRFINEHSRGAATCYENKRDESRSNLSLGVLIVPLKEGQPEVERAVPAIARDISTNGIGIIIPTLLEIQEAIVVLPGDDEALLAQVDVLHRSPIGIGFSLLGTKIVNLLERNTFPVLDELAATMNRMHCQTK